MCKAKLTFVITVSSGKDTNGAFYAFTPGIKGIHVSGYTEEQATEQALKSVCNMLEIYYKKGEKLPENEHFYLVREPKRATELEDNDVLMPVPAYMADAFTQCEQGV